MILADTSVWIQHFRDADRPLARGLSSGIILMHPWVIGELACGNVPRRKTTMLDLGRMPKCKVALDAEVLRLLETHRLWGHGLGWVDLHLLASTLLSGCRLRTLDKRLAKAASDLGVGMA